MREALGDIKLATNPRLKRFFNCHRGERLVLVCNGPSLNQTDFGNIRHEICLGMNKIFLGLKTFKFHPRYYIAVNAKVIEQSARAIQALNCVRFVTDSQKQAVLQESALTYLINTKQPPAEFSFDITQGIREGGTVTYAALQIAFYMGFAKVCIVGMDHRYAFSGKPHEARFMEGPDPNHFSDAYFQNQHWDNPDLQRSEQFYALARKNFEAAGRRIIDCTYDGACTVFEKGRLEEVLR